MNIPSEIDGTARWSLDHLFLDQDGIPTFVECKRATDTRIRREVIAQMFDYAANGVEYWDVDRIRQTAAETAQQEEKSLDDEISRLLGETADSVTIDTFWQSVGENLKRHIIRLLFVSDTAPRELRRIIEFLNEEMANVEVLAVEIKQYQKEANGSQIALVSRVIGASEAARTRKTALPRRRKQTTPDEFFARCSPDAVGLFRTVVEHATKKRFALYWGESGFSVRAPLFESTRLSSFIYCYPPGLFQYYDKEVIASNPSSQIKVEIFESGLLEASGEYTLSTTITESNSAQLVQLVDNILEKINSIRK
jgi:hypothetical protein